jgi:hypothetical protein
MLRSRSFGFAFLIAFILGFSGAAQATSFTLGPVSGPTIFDIGNSKGEGPFTDLYFFSIDPGVALDVSAFVTTGFSRISFIADLDGTLSGASGVIVDGDTSTVFSPEGRPKRDVNFATTLLGPGNYVLSLFGTATAAFPGPTSPYSGQIQFAATPLPGALLLMLTALGGIGILGRLRGRKSA